MNLKSLILYGMLIPFATVFFACGDNGESNPSGSNNIGENFVGEKDPIVLNETNHTMTIYSFRSENRCVVDEDNDKYEFVVHKDTSQVYREYKFLGDTLVILYNKDGEGTYGQVLVGGKNGQIKNKWKLTACQYIYESNSVDCSGLANPDEVIKGSTVYFDITQDTVYISRIDSRGNAIEIDAPEVDDYDDYTGSTFVQGLFEFMNYAHKGIGVAGNSPAPWGAFRTTWSDVGECDIGCVALKKNVTILSRDKKRMSFNFKDVNYELNFSHALKLWYSRGSRTEVSLTLKSDKGECALEYMSDVIQSPEICSAENRGYLDLATYLGNNNTILFYGAKDYHIGNNDEFRQCVVNLVRR